jgi:NAD(P)-dependent dehydrogenase (short-subunit alcohol dehydrogenase family)
MITDFTSQDVPDQSEKTFFITGANTGIGFEAAKAIAGKGGRVLLGCRNRDKGQAALSRIADAHQGADIALVDIDLGDLASVTQAAQIVAREPRLDVLINNAGVMMNPRTITKDGFESQFGVNHLGHFALTSLLLSKLESTPDSRVVVVSSIGHRRGNINFDDINAEYSYSPQHRYYQSKLANLLFTYELDRRLRARESSTIAAAVHPGGADTDLMRHVVKGFRGRLLRLLTPLVRLIGNTAETGAWPTLLGATAPDVEGGQYFGPSRFGEASGPAHQVDSTDRSKNPALAKQLWDLSIEMTGIDPGI